MRGSFFPSGLEVETLHLGTSGLEPKGGRVFFEVHDQAMVGLAAMVQLKSNHMIWDVIRRHIFDTTIETIKAIHLDAILFLAELTSVNHEKALRLRSLCANSGAVLGFKSAR